LIVVQYIFIDYRMIYELEKMELLKSFSTSNQNITEKHMMNCIIQFWGNALLYCNALRNIITFSNNKLYNVLLSKRQ